MIYVFWGVMALIILALLWGDIEISYSKTKSSSPTPILDNDVNEEDQMDQTDDEQIDDEENVDNEEFNIGVVDVSIILRGQNGEIETCNSKIFGTLSVSDQDEAYISADANDNVDYWYQSFDKFIFVRKFVDEHIPYGFKLIAVDRVLEINVSSIHDYFVNENNVHINKEKENALH
jgi:hypothetical protein